MELSEKKIKEFKETGFLIIRGLYSNEKLKKIIQWTNEVTNYPEIKNKYMMYFEESKLDSKKRILSRMENIEPFHKGFSKLFISGEIQKIVSQLFNEEALLFKDKINFKMPGGDGFKAHQDVQAGWDKYAKLHITALVSIDTSSIENGCLEIAPGNHCKGLIGERWQPIDEDLLNYSPVETAPGDAIFFDSYAPHRSGPNLTKDRRRVLYVTYNAISDGDQRSKYYADKWLTYPPDIDRDPNKKYIFKV
ncbi:MAG: phytanoyl-CoA dioxygenase family protein [Gammaproteobacteria bacterium]|tara:strand:+ start:1330 stop:2076 length:747 start_codon:yes stop_codon:yes gene_type:complete